MALTPQQKLDVILRIMASPDRQRDEVFSRKDILHYINKDKISLGLTDEDVLIISNHISPMLDKLVVDGHIMFDPERNKKDNETMNGDAMKYYTITFNGEHFISHGENGYVGQLNRLSQEREKIRVLETYPARLNRLTFWVAFGTIALALIELWKMTLDHHWLSCR